jgi:hypothetical protein
MGTPTKAEHRHKRLPKARRTQCNSTFVLEIPAFIDAWIYRPSNEDFNTSDPSVSYNYTPKHLLPHSWFGYCWGTKAGNCLANLLTALYLQSTTICLPTGRTGYHHITLQNSLKVPKWGWAHMQHISLAYKIIFLAQHETPFQHWLCW